MPSQDPNELIGKDQLVYRILRSRGGQRLLGMGEREMQQFLSGAESALTIPSAEDTAVRASLEDARISAQQRCDLCLEGGGLPSAVALAGAAIVLEERGYAFQRLAGASAGALVAALLAVGYSCAEIRDILLAVDYQRFIDRGSGLLQRARGKGPYSLDYLVAWLRQLVQAKGSLTFGDLRSDADGSSQPFERYRLLIFAAELTRRERVRIPIDLTAWGLDPDALELALAVSAAVSIPEFFEPVNVQSGNGRTHVLGDAAQLGTYDVSVFDRADGRTPQYPTFGAWIANAAAETPSPFVAPDRDRARTIMIPVSDLAPTDFDLPRERLIGLYDTGRSAAEQFLSSWDFSYYLATYGSN
jgi:NTE family protein